MADTATFTDLGCNITALGSHLVDLGLSDVSPLLCLIQFMLQFTELCQIAVSLFLLLNHPIWFIILKRMGAI